MKKTKKIVLFGDSAIAEVAYEYFTHDSLYEVVAFTVSKAFLKQDNLFGLPIVPFEEVNLLYPEGKHEMFVAIGYNQMNRVRIKFYNEAKEKGYTLANYISSKAFVWKNVIIGDNCFIFENSILQPFVQLGNNNILWSGTNIAHHTRIAHHNFFACHVVISGFCSIGNSNFFGANSTMGNNLSIGNDCLIGSSVNVARSVKDGSFIKGMLHSPDDISTYEKFGLIY